MRRGKHKLCNELEALRLTSGFGDQASGTLTEQDQEDMNPTPWISAESKMGSITPKPDLITEETFNEVSYDHTVAIEPTEDGLNLVTKHTQVAPFLALGIAEDIVNSVIDTKRNIKRLEKELRQEKKVLNAYLEVMFV